MLDWLGQMLGLPEEFLARSGGEAGGVIQGTASEATLVALLGAKSRMMQRVKEQHPEWSDTDILSKLVGYCNSKFNLMSTFAKENEDLLSVVKKISQDEFNPLYFG